MQCLLACVVLVQLLVSGESLSFNPDDYLEVYPDPRDPEVLQGRTPLYFALIMNLGGPFSQFDGSGTVAGAKVALDRINNDSSLLPGYTLHFTVANSMCNRTESLIALYSQLLREPKKLAIVGSGCSVATEPAAEISHFYNITQISCVSSSPELRSRLRFPRYFQLLATDEILAYGFYGVIKEYGWRRVALIVQDENLFTVTMDRLKMLLSDGDVDYNERKFNSSAGSAGLSKPFDEDSRIFVLSMYPRNAVFLLCEAYRRGFRAPQYMMLTQSSLTVLWRMELGPDLCTIEERASVLASTFSVISIFALDEVKDANRTTTSGITGKEFLSEERKFFGQPPLNVTFFSVSQYCHDAIWTLAYALNQTYYSLNDSDVNEEVSQAFNVTPPFRLEDFTYTSDKLMELMFDHLSDTSFDGITGPVSFGEDGLRNLSTLLITQFRKVSNGADGSLSLEIVDVGHVILENTDFVYLEGESVDTLWKDGLITYDGVAMKKVVTVHPAITSIYTILACAGIVLAVTCLIFNFIYRNAKLIKLASTKLNYLIGIGAIILYFDIIFHVIPSTDPDVVLVLCNLIPWLTAVGYSLCYGTILAKMARVYYIFNNPSTSKKTLGDRYLVLGVASLVAIDLMILTMYSAVEGAKGKFAVSQVPHREQPRTVEGVLGEITNNYIYICDSTTRDIFLGILYGYKMLLQIVALILAFSIRKVKVKGLNDAKYIAAAIYVTSIVLAVIIVATYTLKDVINGFTALFCTGFLAGTTVILLLVFMPLMAGLYQDPEGEKIFREVGTSSSNGVKNTIINRDTKIVFSEDEMLGLRKRIKELEDEVKEKDAFIASTTTKSGKTTSDFILRSH